MAIRGPNAFALNVRPVLRPLRGALAAGLALAVSACASATVGDIGSHADAAAGSGGSGGNATGGSGGKGGSGGSCGAGGSSTTDVCDPFTNSGCDSSKKCTALQNGNSLSLACGSKGSGAIGAACTATSSGDDCGDELACFSVRGEATPTCRRFCPICGTANACPSGLQCSLAVTGLTDLAFCQPGSTCQPLEQAGCSSSSGQACYFPQTGAQCAPAGSSTPGSTCSRANDCLPGSTCIFVGTTGTCSSFCSTSSGVGPSCSGASTGGSTCAPLGGPSDEANLGSCR